MNWEYIAAHWAQYADSVRRRWGQLDTGQLERVAGSRAALAALIAQTYRISANAAQMQLESWQGRQTALP
jgi:hypothetical protein